MNPKLENISSRTIFAICACYEATMEYEDRVYCEKKLAERGVTFEEAMEELNSRTTSTNVGESTMEAV